jgi:transcriptional regulator with XRE-family HTH domain
MDLKTVFIQNLRRYRNSKEISQMKLAELCDTSANYIGEIEIGRRFPSLKLIERIGAALGVEPYRFFMEEQPDGLGERQVRADEPLLFAQLPDKIKLSLIHQISASE